MAWTETYACDVCGKAKREEAEDWWLVWEESMTPPTPDATSQPVLKMTPWNAFLSHAGSVKHLCGGRCAQTLMDRWMHS